MAYTTPPTWSGSTIVPSSDLQTLSDDIAYLKAQTDLAVFSGFNANRSTNQSIPNNTNTDVTLTTEVWDQGGWIAVSSTTATTPAGAIPPGFTTVILDIRARALFAGNATGARRLIVLQNGSAIYSKAIDAPGATGLTVDLATHTPAVSGDTFGIQVFQDSGGALNISSAGLDISVFKPLS